jgi:hypothetical protein
LETTNTDQVTLKVLKAEDVLAAVVHVPAVDVVTIIALAGTPPVAFEANIDEIAFGVAGAVAGAARQGGKVEIVSACYPPQSMRPSR